MNSITDVLAPAAPTRAMLKDLLLDPDLGGQRVSVDAGTVLYDPHAPAEHAWMIHRGQVRLYQLSPQGDCRLIEILGPDEWFGVEAIAGSGAYQTRAVAVVATTMSQVPGERLVSKVSQHAAVAAELIQQISLKLHEAREDAARLVFDDCNQRLLKTLLRFSRSAAAIPQGEAVVLHITHQQLAQAVGVARETISLALTQLRHQNLLRTGRNQLTFNPQTLQEFAARRNGTVHVQRPAQVEEVEQVA